MAFITLGPPELHFPQNTVVEVNVSEEVVLNCSASSLPDPVYNWTTPDSCTSCPRFSNDSVITFTVDISSSGDFVCVAENKYGTDTKQITIIVHCKLINICICTYVIIIISMPSYICIFIDSCTVYWEIFCKKLSMKF